MLSLNKLYVQKNDGKKIVSSSTDDGNRNSFGSTTKYRRLVNSNGIKVCPFQPIMILTITTGYCTEII